MNTPSVEPVLRSRLLPRISFRMMLAMTAVCAVLAALARVAGNGGQFAASLMLCIGFVIACFVMFVGFFLVAWSAAMFRRVTGLAAVLLSVAIAWLELMGYRLADVSNWPLVAFLIAAGLFLVIVPHRNPDLRTDNPFADGQLPPQILPPREKTL